MATPCLRAACWCQHTWHKCTKWSTQPRTTSACYLSNACGLKTGKTATGSQGDSEIGNTCTIFLDLRAFWCLSGTYLCAWTYPSTSSSQPPKPWWTNCSTSFAPGTQQEGLLSCLLQQRLGQHGKGHAIRGTKWQNPCFRIRGRQRMPALLGHLCCRFDQDDQDWKPAAGQR